MTLAFHQHANLFPLIEGAEFERLVNDIRAEGLLEPIVLLGDEILDGRNRYLASLAIFPGFCRDTNPDSFRDFEGDDPLAWVLSKNLHRRHLDESQRAMVAAKIATGRQGSRTDLEPRANLREVSRAQAADMLHVSERSVTAAKSVRDHGVPELQKAVEQGAVSVSTAQAIASLPAGEQVELVARGEAEILKAAKAINSHKRDVRRQERFANIARISTHNAPLPADRTYPVIYADPPWRFESGFGDRSIENHYPTMDLDDICALPVKRLAADTALLCMWVTVPHLMNVPRVLEAWGFEYKSSAAWDKVDAGTGYWFFSQHEVLIVATRGSFPAPDPVFKARSVHTERKGKHSAKPDFYYELIERMTPGLARIELFCRSPRPGWDAWGNQSKPPLFGIDHASGPDQTVAMEWNDGVLTPCDVPAFLTAEAS